MLEIPCGGCGRALRVPPEHAGKMARCPVCGHITQVPASLGGDSAEWYLKTPEAQTFGPATIADLERWVQEGRITADCQLCQGEAGNWQPAEHLFPSLKSQPTFSPLLTPATPAASTSPPTSMPSHYPPHGGSAMNGPAGFAPRRYVAAHRGALILILGLMGLFIQCPLFPFMSWVMGSNDLREMEAGRMDPAGRDLTRAGMIIGMILSILWILGFLAIFGLMLIGIVGS
jgi:GYF domain 2